MGRTSSWIKLLIAALLAAGVVWLLAPLGYVLQVLVLGALLAYLLDPVVNRVEAQGLGRTVATALVAVGLLALIGVPLALLFPVLAAQVVELQAGIDLGAASEALGQLEGWLEARLRPFGGGEVDLRERAADFVAAHLGDLFGLLPSVLSIATQLVVVPFVAFLLLKDGRRFRKGFIGLIPNRYFEFTLNVLRRADEQLGGYLRGQFLAALIVAVLSILVLWWLGVEYYLIIGIIAGLANLIPYLGPIIGGAVAILVSAATTGSFDMALPIIISFTIIQLIDNVGTQPLLLSRNVELHPLAILLVLLVAGDLFGFVGLLLAVPTAAVLKVLAQDVFTTFRRYRFAERAAFVREGERESGRVEGN